MRVQEGDYSGCYSVDLWHSYTIVYCTVGSAGQNVFIHWFYTFFFILSVLCLLSNFVASLDEPALPRIDTIGHKVSCQKRPIVTFE